LIWNLFSLTYIYYLYLNRSIKLVLTKARFSSQCSWDESRRHFDIIPEIVSYASYGTCETQVSLPPPLKDPSTLEGLRKSSSSHLSTMDHLSYSFSKFDVNFLPLFRTIQNIDFNFIRWITNIFTHFFLIKQFLQINLDYIN